MPNGIELRITFCAVGACNDRRVASSGKMNVEIGKKKERSSIKKKKN